MKFKIGDKAYVKRWNVTGVVKSIRSSRVAPYQVELQNGSTMYQSARNMDIYDVKEATHE